MVLVDYSQVVESIELGEPVLRVTYHCFHGIGYESILIIFELVRILEILEVVELCVVDHLLLQPFVFFDRFFVTLFKTL